MSHDQDIDHHVKIYVRVFVALMILTVITVAAARLELSTGAGIALALLIASVKASLVACYFMHLLTEKKLILWVMALSVVFFFFALVVPYMTEANNISL